MSPSAVTARLRRASELSDLDPDRRLDAKINYSPEAVTARIREALELGRLCAALGRRRGVD